VPEARLLGEEARHLQVRIHARLEAPEKLQEEAVAVDDGGVALLPLQHLRVKHAAAAQLAERARRHAVDAAGIALELAAARDRIEQRERERLVDDRLDQQRAVAQPGHRRRRARLLLLGAARVRDGERKEIALRLA